MDGFERVNQVSEKHPTSRADAKPSLASSRGSAIEIDSKVNRSTKHGATEANIPGVAARYNYFTAHHIS